jgi:RNA polymerase subunit RPABC4/transcription elongation factor Spt4
LTIFGSESDSAAQGEEQVVREGQPAVEAKPTAAQAPKAETAKEAAAEAALFQCPNCNGAVKESDNVCPHCGAMFVEEEVSQFECPACGTLVNADATTCPGCGAIFVEDEAAAEAASAGAPKAAPAAAPTPAAAAATEAEGEESVIVVESSSEATAQDEDIRRKVLEIKEGRGQEAAEAKKVKKPGLGGLFKGGKKEEEATPAVPQKVVVAPKPAAVAPQTMAIAPPPTVKRQFPTDPKAQGIELAKMVNDVRSLLNIATERRLIIDESKDMLDHAIAAGRERQLQNALTLISTAEDRLNIRLREYAVATFSSLQDEMTVAKKLGGNTAKSEVLAKEAKRAAETPDYQAAFVFIDKAKAELAPITGKYNAVRDILRKYERLVKDSRAVGIDNEPLKETLEEAKAAFDALDFDKADSIAHGSTEEIMGQVKGRIGPEIDKAKSMLVEVKMKSESGGIGPQITILKSAIKAYKEENYLEALAEIKRFKKEMKKLINPT